MELTYIGVQFRGEMHDPFSLHKLKRKHRPVALGSVVYKPKNAIRVNHLLIKLKHSDEIILPEGTDPEIFRFIEDCVESSKINNFPMYRRFMYLTVDNKFVKKGESQRTRGWHLDGLQGEEVPLKKPACYQYVWMNKLPFKFTTQDFIINGMDLSRHNIFDSLGAQVYPESVASVHTNQLYLMNPYLLHQAAIADEDIDDRLFMRLYVSELPITSVKMTINPKIEYPYEVHSTTGQIPDNLRVWSPDSDLIQELM